jgi:Transcriptional regulator
MIPPNPEKSRKASTGKSPGNREKILAVALHLFTTQGFHATPTAQISKEAGVSTGTLFHYFPDKDILIDQLYLSIKKDMAESIRAYDDPALQTEVRLERFFTGYVAWGLANPDEARFVEQFCNSPNIGDDVKREGYQEFVWLHDIEIAAVREGLLPDLPPDFHSVMIGRILNATLALVATGVPGMSQEGIIRASLAMLKKR